MTNSNEHKILKQFETLSQIQPDAAAAELALAKTRNRILEHAKTQTKWNIWGQIMKSPITKLAAAAIIIIAIGLFTWLAPEQTQNKLNGLDLFTRACKAEENFFAQTGILHIINEIIIQPGAGAELAPNRPRKSTLDFLKFSWIPMTSLSADGQFRFNQLQLPSDSNQAYTVIDESYYDSATGRFARVLRAGDEAVFANAYDGNAVYSWELQDGKYTLIGTPVSEKFNAPREPAAFLGLTAGFKSQINEETMTPVKEVTQGILSDGTPAQIVKAAYTDARGTIVSYWLFKIREDDSTIAEMEFFINNLSQLLIRRDKSETVNDTNIPWNLSNFQSQTSPTQKVSVKTDMVVPDVTVEQMATTADYETYIFATDPNWTTERQITDCIDPPSPGHRMFSIAYKADDHRHVVLVQCHTYNSMLGNFAKQGTLVYQSPNGFKVWGGGPDKWYSEILLSSAGYFLKDKPADDRTGYMLESPAGTFPSLAINGQITEQELHSIIDSLIPAKDYKE